MLHTTVAQTIYSFDRYIRDKDINVKLHTAALNNKEVNWVRSIQEP